MAEAAAGGAGGAAPGVPVVLKNGQVIQNYEIVKPLGKGKFSIVYMAKRLTDGTMCALKKINIFDMMVPKQREKCLKEVRLLQSLDHPNIVKLKDSFIDVGELFIIVEWAEKGDLKWLIRRALARDVRFKETEIWEYSRQLSGALDHMHQKRIMHRDLKPANIFVTIDGSLKLGDLGLGRFFSSQTLEAFSKVGTPLYMSPEVLRGAGYDMRSDVWSLGCVLYELSMLRSPFKSDQQLSLYDLFVRISKGDYPPLPETVSADFRELVGWMLALDPEKRFHCSQVLEVCNARVAALVATLNGKDEASAQKAQQFSASASRISRPSPLLVMDDIVEKLKLLECEEQFLQVHGYPLLHRCFFAQKVELPGQICQFEVMIELIRWLLGQASKRDAKGSVEAVEREEAADASAGPPCKAQSKATVTTGNTGIITEADAGAGDVAAGRGTTGAARCRSKGDPTESIQEVVAELAARGIQASADSTLAQLREGYGEGVCLILNELINQELVGRDFHFEAPQWGDLHASGASHGLEEIDEELGDSASIASQGSDEACASEESCHKYSTCSPNAAVTEGSLAGSTAGLALEQVHQAKVDPEAWRAECERVKSRLKMSADALRPVAGWQGTFSQARQLCDRVNEICLPPLLSEGLLSCCRQLRYQLKELRHHEDRINAHFSGPAAEAARLRVAATPEAETVATLQSSISDLSEQLSTVTEELEKRKSEAAGQSEAALDADKLPNLKKAFQRLRDESLQLEQRIGCVQADLSARGLRKGTAQECREQGATARSKWYSEGESNSLET